MLAGGSGCTGQQQQLPQQHQPCCPAAAAATAHGSGNGLEALHKLVYEFLCTVDTAVESATSASPALSSPALVHVFHRLGAHIVHFYDNKVQGDDPLPADDAACEAEWATLAWLLQLVISRVQLLQRVTPAAPSLAAASEDAATLDHQLNLILVELVNSARPVNPPLPLRDGDPLWQAFYKRLSETLHSLHALYSQLERPDERFEENIRLFGDRQLLPCLAAFRELCVRVSDQLQETLRSTQMRKMAGFDESTEEASAALIAFHYNVMYTLGVLAARLQGFRFELLQTKGCMLAVSSDSIKPLLESVLRCTENLISDALFPCEPSSCSILVTNNLFPYQCACLAPPLIFKHFNLQIVSEETAQLIQAEMRAVKLVGGVASTVIADAFPSAALLAMKPTSGVKRNNATASAEGGNTAHKKSDVNSRESVQLAPTFSETGRAWHAAYPHLLCTTRQKDAVLLDTRTVQIGKRPLFYFYVRGVAFSPVFGSSSCATSHVPHGQSFTYSMSMPFTIATRRNQDCQVQRMMSSYTATCFWLFGTARLACQLFEWREDGVPWSRFKLLLRTHFKVQAEVSRILTDAECELLEEKMHCVECDAPPTKADEEATCCTGERIVTFKNMLCPHLRFEVLGNGGDAPPCSPTSSPPSHNGSAHPSTSSTANVRFSIWRGMLELLQMFNDLKTGVAAVWEANILHGFSDADKMASLLSAHPHACIASYISLVAGGAVCFVVRRRYGSVVHIVPIDLKRLQNKPAAEYLRDIADCEHVDSVLCADGKVCPLGALHAHGGSEESGRAANARGRLIRSNVTHGGGIERTTDISYTRVRIAVVTCDADKASSPAAPVVEEERMDDTTGSYSMGGGEDFYQQLDALMTRHARSSNEVYDYLYRKQQQMHESMMMQSLPAPIAPSAVASAVAPPLQSLVSSQHHQQHHHQQHEQQQQQQQQQHFHHSISMMAPPLSSNSNSSAIEYGSTMVVVGYGSSDNTTMAVDGGGGGVTVKNGGALATVPMLHQAAAFPRDFSLAPTGTFWE